MQSLDLRRLSQFPSQCVFAAAGTDEKEFHNASRQTEVKERAS